jgi:hypothetical protein
MTTARASAAAALGAFAALLFAASACDTGASTRQPIPGTIETMPTGDRPTPPAVTTAPPIPAPQPPEVNL